MNFFGDPGRGVVQGFLSRTIGKYQGPCSSSTCTMNLDGFQTAPKVALSEKEQRQDPVRIRSFVRII